MRRKIAWVLSTVLICSNILGTVSLAETGNTQSNTERVGQTKEVAKEVTIASFVNFDAKGTKPYVKKEIASKTTVADIGLPNEVQCILEGSEEEVSVPVQWVCREDYTAIEKEAYLFDIKLSEGYRLSEKLQTSVEKGESKLPTAQVEIKKEPEKGPVKEGKTDIQEEKNAPEAVQRAAINSRLTPESLPSSESGTYMSYITGNGYYDIKGAGGVGTTYYNRGYKTALQVGNNTQEGVGIAANGKVWTSAEDNTIQIQQKLTLVGKNVKVSFLVENIGTNTKKVKYGSHADVEIDGDDAAKIVRTDVGMRMIADTGKQFNLICKSGSTPVDTMWFGKYSNAEAYVFSNTSEAEYLGDSGLAFSWTSEIPAGGKVEKSVLFSVASTPTLQETETKVESSTGVIKVSQGFTDAAGSVDELHYKLDDGNTQKLTGTVTATGGDDIISGEIPIPATWQDNTLHKLTIWIYNDSYASSETKDIDIVYRNGAVVPATEHTVSFAKGDGASGTAPTAVKELEAAEITLPSQGNLSKNGYTFVGWSDGTTVYQAGAKYKIPDTDITLTAVWKANDIAIDTIGDVSTVYGTAIANKTLSTSGGTGSYKYTIDANTPLPAGITLTEAGVLSGTPTVTTAGEVSITVNVEDTSSGKSSSGIFKMTVHKRPLQVTGAANLTKEYDGDTDIAVGALTLDGILSGDNVTASGTAVFADVNAGTGKTINLTDVALSGNKKDNYSIADTATLTTGMISARSITVKPKDSNKLVGQQIPAGVAEEVITTTSALQGNDTIDGLGTPEFDYAKVKEETGSYEVSLTIQNPNPNYKITCEKGILTVGQDSPLVGTNYQVTGTQGNESWYTTKAAVAPMGTIYDKILYDGKEVDSIEIADESKEITFALKDTKTGSVTKETTITVKSDIKAPELGAVEVKAKNSGVLAEIGRTLTFGHFFKEAVEVKVKVTDAVSGVAKLQYKLPNGTYQDAAYGNGTATFDIPLGTDGTIQMQAFDTAGNQNVESNLTKDGTDVWVTENTAPVIAEFTFDKTAQNGWYKEDVTVSANVTEEKSGLNNVKVRYADDAWKALLENPTERTLSYDYSGKLTENGENKVTLKAEDNATNLAAEKTATVKIDKELPQIQDIAGNPDKWQNKQAEITFKLSDALSGINEDSVKVMKDNASEVAVTKEGETYHFTTDGNAVYTVAATDKAGNALTNSAITVSKIQTAEPTKPDISEIENSITIGGDPDNTEGLPTKPAGWYTKPGVEIGLTNPTIAPGQAPQTYYYMVWEEGTNPADAKEVKFDGTNPPVFEKDGIWNVSIVLKDEAGNKSEPITTQVKVDSEVPQIEHVKGNPDKWQNEEATITVDLKDSVSGIDESTIKVSKDGVEVNVSYKDGAASFETEGNGNYVITAEDKAGNLVTKTVEVTKIQTTPPEPPKEDEIDDNITIGGDKEETEGLPTTPDGWYTKPNVEIGLKNPEVGEGEVPQTYYYKVWEEGADPAEAKIVAFDGKNPPILADDGKWNIAIWLEDEAGNKSQEIVKTVKVDTTAPEAVTEQDHFVVKQGKEQQAEVKLSDVTSGLRAEQVKVTLKGEAVEFELLEQDGEYTVTFNTKKGGIYLVQSIDEAGNKTEYPITVTAVNSTIKCSEGVSATTNLDALIEAMDLSAFKNGETVTLSLDVQEKEERTLDAKVKKGILSLTRADAKMHVLDIRILQHVEDIEGKVVENTIDKLDKPIKITTSIPEAIRGKYNYKIVREHNGKLEVIKSVVSDDGTKIEFESNQFSIYTLTYTDTKEVPKKPGTPVKDVEKPKAVKTGDNSFVMMWAVLIIMMPIVMGSVIFLKKKQRIK